MLLCSHYIPRSNPDGFAVTLACIDPGSITSSKINTFDGLNWEANFATSTIGGLSKE